MKVAPLSTTLAHQGPFAGWAPDVVMFDLDGTLVDTMGYFADLASELIATHYQMAQFVARQRYLATSGVPFRQQLELIFPGDPRNEPTAETYEGRKGALCKGARMDSGTLTTLRWLHDNGVRVVVSSNAAQHFVDEFADEAGFPFTLALGFGNGLAKGRPHVDLVKRALRLRSEQILFVGDSLKDGELAAECDLRFVGHTGTFKSKDFWARFPGCVVVEQIDGLQDVFLLGR